jgi:hypothetical protein
MPTPAAPARTSTPGMPAPSVPPAPPAAAPTATPPAGSTPAFGQNVVGRGTPAAGVTPAGGRRAINPFLNNDPNMKGRRLARALVSDMIAYQPGKREEGLRDGTLKAIFREEIKKSYEEYVDQIGKEFAESTTHFQDALNDLLAGGQKMF